MTPDLHPRLLTMRARLTELRHQIDATVASDPPEADALLRDVDDAISDAARLLREAGPQSG